MSFVLLLSLLCPIAATFAEEPRAAEVTKPTAPRGNASPGLGLDMLLRRPTGDDWILFGQIEYEYNGNAKLEAQVARALQLARQSRAPASLELPIDTDDDTRPDAWVYFENGKPAFVELDIFDTGGHDLRVDLRREPPSVQRHRYWFAQPPVPLATANGTALETRVLFDWAAPLDQRGSANAALFAAAQEVLPVFAADAAALAKSSADAALAKRLAETTERARLLLPKFAEIHRREGLADKLKIHQGVQITFRPYDLDSVKGAEVVVGYAPWGVESIQFHKTDWLAGGQGDDPRASRRAALAEVFWKGDMVARVDLDARRYFPLGGHWVRTAQDARRPLAEKLLLPAYQDYRSGRWYAAAAKFKQAALAVALLGDLRLSDRGRPLGSLRDEGEEGWNFDVGGYQARDLFDLGRALISGGETPEVFALANAAVTRGRSGEALALYALSQRFCDKGHKTLRKVLALERMSDIYHALGNYDRAIECLFQSLDLEATLGYSADVMENLRVLAGRPDDPEIMQRTMQIRTHAMAVNRCGKLGRIAAHQVELGEVEKAKTYLTEAERLSTPLGHPYLAADLLCLRARLDLAEGRTDLALERLKRAYAMFEREAAEQPKLEHGADLLRKGQSAHFFTVFGEESRFVLSMRAETPPAAYLSLAAGLVAEALMQRAAELPPEAATDAALLLADARTWQTKALKFSRDANDPAGALVGELRLAVIAAQEGDHAAALASAEKIITQSRREERFETLWRGLSLAGAAHLARGETAAAISSYEAAAKEIESLRARLHSEPVRRGFFGSKIDVYEQLARLYLHGDSKNTSVGQAASERVWQCMERAKARTLLDTVGGQALRLKGDAVAEATKQAPLAMQSLALRSAVDGETSDLENLADRPRLQEVASFSAVQPANLAALTAVLGAEDVLIEYFATREELLAAVIQQGKLKLVRLPGVSEETLRNDVENFRRQIEDPRGVYEPVARRLFDRLLAPCLTGTTKIDRLCIVPGGALHYLPFAALMLPDGKFLLEKYPLFTAPSASALVYAYHRRSGNRGSQGIGALVAADPLPQLGFNPLPHAAREGREVHRLAKNSPPLLLGKSATESAIVAALAGARSFHFAGHTHLPASSPLRAALMCTEDLDRDGRLEVRELLEMNLAHCELAVLSACETRLGRYSRGDEMVGLERAFLRAGVPTVVTSLWKVDDAATQVLMVEFYANLWTKKQGKLDSLRAAQLALLDGRLKPRVDEAVRALGLPAPLPGGGQAAPSTRHPKYWAAFVLSGDWR